MRRPTWIGVGAFVLILTPLGVADQGAKPTSLPAPPKGFDAKRAGIARGKVETVGYDSKTVGARRPLILYMPPGYPKEGKYPVLYLLHGIGDDETGWVQKG